jgi:hypothetical protein
MATLPRYSRSLFSGFAFDQGVQHLLGQPVIAFVSILDGADRESLIR